MALVRWEVRYNFALMEQLRYEENNRECFDFSFEPRMKLILTKP
jgi:hypothetical protein